jgi:hypothetical protein
LDLPRAGYGPLNLSKLVKIDFSWAQIEYEKCSLCSGIFSELRSRQDFCLVR